MKIKLLLLLLFIVQFPSFSQSKSAKIDELLKAWHAVGQFNGNVLVFEKGKIILESGYGYRNVSSQTLSNPQTIYQVGSVTKQFTAAIILKLVQEGKLKLTDKLSMYYPAFPKADSVSIHHLLNHSSGVYNYTEDALFMQNEVTKPVTEQKMLALFAANKFDFSPGTRFKYSNSGFYILGAIIQKITGKPFEQVVTEQIFRPLGMDHSGFDFVHLNSKNKATGYAVISDEEVTVERQVDSSVSFSAGSIYSTAGDLLKWHQALLTNKILSRVSLNKAFTDYKEGFGYGWVVDSVYNRKIVYHNGSILGFTSNIYRIESDNTCIIILNNIGNRQIDRITADIVSILYDQAYTVPEIRLALELQADSAKKYFGVYEFNPSFKLKIFPEAGNIYAQKLGEDQKFRIYYYKEHSFFLKKMDARLEFLPKHENCCSTMVLHQSGKEMSGVKLNE